MITPNGRFSPNVRICLSMSDCKFLAQSYNKIAFYSIVVEFQKKLIYSELELWLLCSFQFIQSLGILCGLYQGKIWSIMGVTIYKPYAFSISWLLSCIVWAFSCIPGNRYGQHMTNCCYSYSILVMPSSCWWLKLHRVIYCFFNNKFLMFIIPGAVSWQDFFPSW